ncbi:MAG: hypothetical protein A2Y03_06990 [Omnitrophica WOR_2 bacterium GWF2_38_59]|nr:MAG: hypothetical protein A2Y03_06990 [Omnitrophica WOR_2 bacterium GWF2_38_59]OGX47413.1 MAG: hypothetical protein A2243_01635 [Omnitrophica WOR_2 bacterium RIFOXYA2_FULL_38_17]OGX55024.1 MAG: hypothetical protein A2447_10855 [Omnitrophica WOR_2 bacterium RIFOXYC2_FULL_38_12]OGX57993.1 MAG: hypothetical protein A2306_05300 [Omnitrophica WOR_2 bacterium RIFOXYB2_FULL_38_16]
MIESIVGVVFGGFVSWFISHKYYEKSSNEKKILIETLSKDLKERNSFDRLQDLIEDGNWKKAEIQHKEVWISEQDNTFQILRGEMTSEFHESWTLMYSDQNTSQHKVYLKINDSIVKELYFISLDGGRRFAPMTEREFVNNKPVYYWDINSLEVKACRIIGEYYRGKDLEDVARESNVEMRN